jgi:hypothetical protein
VAAVILALAGLPMAFGAFAGANPEQTLIYGSVLISLSTAFAAVQLRSMKR